MALATAPARARAPLADYLEDRREELGLTIRGVASRCGKAKSWYERIASGGRKGIRQSEIKLLEKALQVPDGELVRRAAAAGF